MSDVAEEAGKVSEPRADVRRPSESATLVCAVALAVTLGVACGFWINSLLASAADRAAPASHTEATTHAVDSKNLQASAETAEVKEPLKEPAAAVVESRALKPAATPAARDDATTQTKPRARL